MLEGEQALDFQKAVFVVENAWHDNGLDYVQFRADLASITKACERVIARQGLQQYKTAGNWAIFAWMTQKIPENNYQKCIYNFDDFLGRNSHANTLITTLLETKKGTCYSLPVLYKCLAQGLEVEAKLTLGPNHAWIRHVDEYGKWANLGSRVAHDSTRTAWFYAYYT